ncbi:MAG: PstA family ABC transporter permease, partial [Methylococcales bacterium]
MADRVFTLVNCLLVALVVAVFAWILADLVLKGAALLSGSFLIEAPSDAGRSGGIGPILLSTLLILAVALGVAIPLGLMVAVWLAEFAPRGSRTGQIIGLSLDSLAGVPSIVYGLFGNAFFCIVLGLGFSILSGALTLACMILPVFIRTCEFGLSAVNDEWRKGALAPGMCRTATVWHILLPAASPAILAGLI